MHLTRLSQTIGVVLTLAAAAPAWAAEPPGAAAQATQAQPSFDLLEGTWVRPDGGYTVTIRSVAADGGLDASYANPNPLSFSKATASRSNGSLRVFLELTAAGYNGSTYTLTYDPVGDRLQGTYFQAVAGQSYEIFFERRSPKPGT